MGGGKGRNKKMDDGSPDLVTGEREPGSLHPRLIGPCLSGVVPPSIFDILFYFGFIPVLCLLRPPRRPG